MTYPQQGPGADPNGWYGQQNPHTPPPGYGPPHGGAPSPGHGMPPGQGMPPGSQQYPGYGPPQGYGAPQGYGTPPGGYPGYGIPGNPYGVHPNVDPMTGQPLSDKTKMVAGLLQILVGTVGAGRWYTGHTGIALAQLFTCGGCGIWALIDGIMLLTQGGEDAEGRKLRES